MIVELDKLIEVRRRKSLAMLEVLSNKSSNGTSIAHLFNNRIADATQLKQPIFSDQ